MDAIAEKTASVLADLETQPLLRGLKKQRDTLLKRQGPKTLLQPKKPSERFKFTRKDDRTYSSSESSESLELPEPTKELDAKKPIKEQILQMLKMISRLFQFSSTRDKCILAVGTLATIVHGASFPVLAILFGTMSNAFLLQSNSTAAALTANHSSDYLIPIISSNASEFNMTGVTNFTGNANADAIIGGLSSAFRSFMASHSGPLTKDEFAEYVTNFALYYVCIGLIVFVSSFLQTACWEWAAENQIYRVRQTYMYDVLRQEMTFFDKFTTGALVLRLADDCERVREGIGHKFSMIIELISIFFFGGLFGVIANYKLALTFLGSTPLAILKILLLWKSISKQAEVQQIAYGKAGTISAEVLTGMRTVAAFGKELEERDRYGHSLQKGQQAAFKKYLIVGAGTGVGYLVIYGFYAIAFWYGISLLMVNSVSPGDIYMIFFSVTLCTYALGSILPFANSIATAFASGRVLGQIMRTTLTIDPYSQDGIVPKKLYGKIKFENVNFAYPSRKDAPIFQNLNLSIFCGQKIAIVGPSGSGKSTLISLLLRFYDPQAGSIKLDNQELRSLNVPWLRCQFSIVPQQTVFFLGSIMDNLTCGFRELKLADVIKVAKLTMAHEFISELPDGYSTIIGISGKQLSSGQRQRLAITRALMQNRSILILDEATASIEPKMAAKIEANIDKVRKGKTTIYITHRLKSVHTADFIFVLKGGEIVEAGTHNGLLKAQGAYYNFIMQEELLEKIPDAVESSDSESKDDTTASDAADIDREKEAFRRMKKMYRRRDSKCRLDMTEWLDEGVRAVEEFQYPPLSRKLKLMVDEWPVLTYGLLGCLFSGLMVPMMAICLGHLFETFQLKGDALYYAGTMWTGILVALAVIAGVSYFVRIMCICNAGEIFTLKLRMEAYESILRQQLSWFDSEVNSPARLYTRLASDVPNVKTAVGSRLASAISAIVAATAGVIISFIYGWEMAIVTLLAGPIIFGAAYLQVVQLRIGYMRLSILMEDMVRLATRSIQEIWTIQVLSRMLDVCEKFEDFNLPALFLGHKQALIYGLTFAFSEAVVFLIFGAAFRLGAELIRIDQLEPVALFTVFFALAFASLTLGQATSYIPEYLRARLSSAFIFNLIDLKSTADPLSEDGLKPAIQGTITFKNVCFHYPLRPGHKVLQGLTFEIPAGKTLGILGETGEGKSCLLSLLLRFYEVEEGAILIDGTDIRDMNLSHLRANMAFVAQEPNLFDRSIQDNIAYGLVDPVPKDELEKLVEEAADLVNADEFIEEFGEKYDTSCGERGGNLTGGQKQRIALARAFIRKAKILLLDDPTSAVDIAEEKVVLAAVRQARMGRTTIIASNRPSILQDSDYIAVLAKGIVAEFGTPDELLAKKGLYHNLVQQEGIKAHGDLDQPGDEEEEEECLTDQETDH